MASKSGQEPSASTEDIEELLDGVDKTLDRLKTMYEQYFLGIQKQAPAYIHSDVERKLRDLMQLQIRNTGLRYRLNSIQAKFAAYNSYWRRTLRQIENGTYIRNLSKIGRQAARSGADIPEEILAAMPKRMREQVLKDREVAIAAARRQKQLDENELLQLDDEPAFVKEGTDLRRQVKGAHVVKDDGDFDIDAFFKEVESGPTDDRTEDNPPVPAPEPVRAAPAVRPVVPVVPPQRVSSPVLPPQRASNPAMPQQPGARSTGPVPTYPRSDTEPGTPDNPGLLRPPPGPVPRAATNPGLPPVPPPRIPTAPSQAVRPNPIAPGSAAARGDVPVESMAGPFPRQPTGQVPRVPTGPVPSPSATGPVPRQPTGPVPRMPTDPAASGPIPVMTETGPVPRMTPSPGATGPMPRQPTGPVPNPNAVPRSPTGPMARPPGAPRPAPPVSAQSQPHRATPMPQQESGNRPPPGMTDADVNALYAKYVKAKESVGEQAGPGAYGKLLKTINQQAPKIMEQYKAKGVDFSVVVKDNQVIIRAKPKP